MHLICLGNDQNIQNKYHRVLPRSLGSISMFSNLIFYYLDFPFMVEMVFIFFFSYLCGSETSFSCTKSKTAYSRNGKQGFCVVNSRFVYAPCFCLLGIAESQNKCQHHSYLEISSSGSRASQRKIQFQPSGELMWQFLIYLHVSIVPNMCRVACERLVWCFYPKSYLYYAVAHGINNYLFDIFS